MVVVVLGGGGVDVGVGVGVGGGGSGRVRDGREGGYFFSCHLCVHVCLAEV